MSLTANELADRIENFGSRHGVEFPGAQWSLYAAADYLRRAEKSKGPIGRFKNLCKAEQFMQKARVDFNLS